MPIQRKPISPEEALNRMSALCAKSEYCPADVRDKLLRLGLTAVDAEHVVDRLIDMRFIDTERYVRAFIHDKFTYELWGRIKIRFALRAKRLPDDLIDTLLESAIDDDLYAEHLDTLLRRKLRTLSQPMEPADRAKLYRYAAQRGYEPSDIARSLQRLRQGDDTDDTFS